jgi:hypothetical protein
VAVVNLRGGSNNTFFFRGDAIIAVEAGLVPRLPVGR